MSAPPGSASWWLPTGCGSAGAAVSRQNWPTKRHSSRRFPPGGRDAALRPPSSGPAGLGSGMVPPANLLAFALTALVLIAVPGPSVLFVIGRTLALGRRGGLLSVLG